MAMRQQLISAAGELAWALVSALAAGSQAPKQPRMVRTEPPQAAEQAAARHVLFALAVPAALQQVAQQPEAPLRSALAQRKSARLVATSDVAGVLRLVERRQQSGQADPIALYSQARREQALQQVQALRPLAAGAS
jgi:hypothetical protein